MKPIEINCEQIHGWELLNKLEPIHRNYAKRWFNSRPEDLRPQSSSRAILNGTIIGDESRGDGKLVEYETIFVARSADRIFFGVAPTPRSAIIRINKLLKSGICKAAGYPCSTR